MHFVSPVLQMNRQFQQILNKLQHVSSIWCKIFSEKLGLETNPKERQAIVN